MMKMRILILLFLLFMCTNLYTEFYDGVFIIINDDAITYNEFKSSYIKLKQGLLRIGQPLPRNAKLLVFNNLINEKIITIIRANSKIPSAFNKKCYYNFA